MTFQNEQNELVSQNSASHKRTPNGVTSMKKVIRARSKNVELRVECNSKGQPLNNKGGNTLSWKSRLSEKASPGRERLT
ncbi:hypothetical protein Lal_00033257 [Lupinus albus]|nr:hypothetical protein Lal_00033257 [Lupinus albus]